MRICIIGWVIYAFVFPFYGAYSVPNDEVEYAGPMDIIMPYATRSELIGLVWLVLAGIAKQMKV